MRTINEIINEGIFDDIACSLAGHKYNRTYPTKDCLGQPLKAGDLVIAYFQFKTAGVYLATYIEKQNKNQMLVCRVPEYSDWQPTHSDAKEYIEENYIDVVYCQHVIKIDPKLIKH